MWTFQPVSPSEWIIKWKTDCYVSQINCSVEQGPCIKGISKNDSIFRIVFATVAFGMGVDIPDVEQVVHWGAPRGIEQVVYWGAPRGLEQVV